MIQNDLYTRVMESNELIQLITSFQTCAATFSILEKQKVALSAFETVTRARAIPSRHRWNDVSALLSTLSNLLVALGTLCREDAVLKDSKELTSYICKVVCILSEDDFPAAVAGLVEAGWADLLVRALSVQLHDNVEENENDVLSLINTVNSLLSGYEFDCVDTLIAAGAEKPLEEAMAKYNLNRDIKRSGTRCLLMLKKDWCGVTPLHKAALEGNAEAAAHLLDSGAFIDTPDSVGRSPLHCAVINGHMELVTLLLDREADIEAREQAMGSPLHCAAGEQKLEIITILLNRGADIEAINNVAETPLSLAASEGHIDVVTHLLNSGANIEGCAEGDTPIFAALGQGHQDIFILLLGRGASIEGLSGTARQRAQRWTQEFLQL